MKAFKKEEMTTMVSLMDNLYKEGYVENFVAKGIGIIAPTSKKAYKPQHVKVKNFYRFEGESDPADNSILYAIETEDGTKGLLVDAYGVYTNPCVSKFILEVQEIEKGKHVNVNV